MSPAMTRNLTIAFFVMLAAGTVSPMVLGGARFPQWLEVVIGERLTSRRNTKRSIATPTASMAASVATSASQGCTPRSIRLT